MAGVRHNSRSEQQPAQHAEHAKREVEMPPQHLFEGEDADITGHETIRHEEDEDHYAYPDADLQSVTLVTGVPSDASYAAVDRDVVMAAQGSVVLPSKSADGGLQFVEVAHSTGGLPAAGAEPNTLQLSDKSMTTTSGEKDEFDRSSVGAVEGSEEILHIPADALASVKNANFQATTVPSDHTDSGIQYFRSDPCQVVMLQQPVSASQAGERLVEGSENSGVEGSEDIMNIPSDSLASVKHANLATSQQSSRQDEGEVAWSERNVESNIVAQTPTAAVSHLFNLASPAGEQQPQQQQEQHKPLNVVV